MKVEEAAAAAMIVRLFYKRTILTSGTDIRSCCLQVVPYFVEALLSESERGESDLMPMCGVARLANIGRQCRIIF